MTVGHRPSEFPGARLVAVDLLAVHDLLLVDAVESADDLAVQVVRARVLENLGQPVCFVLFWCAFTEVWYCAGELSGTFCSTSLSRG